MDDIKHKTGIWYFQVANDMCSHVSQMMMVTLSWSPTIIKKDLFTAGTMLLPCKVSSTTVGSDL